MRPKNDDELGQLVDLTPLNRLFSAQDVAELLGVSRRTVFRLRASGALPAPFEISTNTVRWRYRDILDYLSNLRIRKSRNRC
jgi:excisionase family DNA binding protein